jgi:hypothetical protein
MGAVILFSLAYFSTQYSYSLKSPLLANNYPAVLGMMGVAATLAFINPIQDERKNFSNSEI